MRRNPQSCRLRYEPPVATRTPYTAQLSEHLVRTAAGDYIQVFRLGGVGSETVDDELINARHEHLNILWRSLGTENVSLWTHLVRERVTTYPDGVFVSNFARELDTRYRRRLSGERLMGNALYLSLAYHPTVGATSGVAARLLKRSQEQGEREAWLEATEACAKLAQTVNASLSAYEPQHLGIYTHKNRVYSAVLEFLAYLINGEWQRIPLPRAPLNEVLATSRCSFGIETVEYRGPTHSRLAAFLGIKEYASPTVPGLLDALLSAPFPLILTQSFTALAKGTAQGLLLRQHRRMVNAGDYGISQAEALHEALDALTGNEFVLGDHHLSLAIFVDEEEGAPDRSKALHTRIAIARRLMADAGLLVAREDMALEAAAWAQLPGCFALRPRRAPITSRNFAAFSPFHTHPGGRAQGNYWGEALAVFVSSARSPFYFSLHATDPSEPDGGSRRDVGHTLILGPSGSGKTVLIGFLMAMLEKVGATQIIIDKDKGLEVLTRALGGEYRSLDAGVPTGFNPLRLEPTPANIDFLRRWLHVLARGANSILSAREQADLDHALAGTLALAFSARRLSRLVEFLDSTEAEGVYARLSRWCQSTGGAHWMVFDNDEDLIAERLKHSRLLGFDVTAFLYHPEIRVPVTLYLLHLVGSLLDGRRLVCWCDEFSKLLDDVAFESFAKNALDTWRKLNAVFVAATQSASHALLSPISRTIVEQTATKILFPHPNALEAEYVEGLALSEREFECVREIAPGTRRFLVKQVHSVVCELPLHGFTEQLAVISGRAHSVQLMHRLIAEYGESPSAWLPQFMTHFSKVSHAS